jgi:uncharacterized protein YbaR (Trm112 family)
VAMDGVLFVASRNRVFAIQDGIPAKGGDAP